MSSNFT